MSKIEIACPFCKAVPFAWNSTDRKLMVNPDQNPPPCPHVCYFFVTSTNVNGQLIEAVWSHGWLPETMDKNEFLMPLATGSLDLAPRIQGVAVTFADGEHEFQAAAIFAQSPSILAHHVIHLLDSTLPSEPDERRRAKMVMRDYTINFDGPEITVSGPDEEVSSRIGEGFVNLMKTLSGRWLLHQISETSDPIKYDALYDQLMEILDVPPPIN